MHGFPDNLHISLRDFAVARSWRGELVRKSAAFLSRRIRAFGLSIRVITNSYSREFRLRLRSGARLLSNELLGRAVQIARRIAGGVHGTSRRAHDHAGVLAVHDLRVTSDQARRGCLRRYQGSRSQRDWLDQPWGITHNQNA